MPSSAILYSIEQVLIRGEREDAKNNFLSTFASTRQRRLENEWCSGTVTRSSRPEMWLGFARCEGEVKNVTHPFHSAPEVRISDRFEPGTCKDLWLVREEIVLQFSYC